MCPVVLILLRPLQRKAEAKTRIFSQSFSHGNTGVPVIKKKKYPLEDSRNGMDCIVEPKAGPSGLSLQGHVATEVNKVKSAHELHVHVSKPVTARAYPSSHCMK